MLIFFLFLESVHKPYELSMDKFEMPIQNQRSERGFRYSLLHLKGIELNI